MVRCSVPTMSHNGHFRAHGRRRVDLPASLLHSPDDAPRTVRVLNLSLGGACAELSDPLEPGANVTLEIVAPTLWDPLCLKGQVVWCTLGGDAPPRVGMHFEHREAPMAFALFELLGSHDYDD